MAPPLVKSSLREHHSQASYPDQPTPPMPRRRQPRCDNCKRLKIKCDSANPCEYCVATNKTCVYPAGELTIVPFFNEFADRFNSPETHLGITEFEFSLINRYTKLGEPYIRSGIDQQSFIWKVLLPQWIAEEEVVREAICANMAMEIIQELGGDDTGAIPDSLVQLDHYSHSKFDNLVKYVGRLMAEFISGTISTPDLEMLLITSGFVVEVMIYDQMLPFVDFVGKYDFLQVLSGYIQCRNLAKPHMETSPYYSIFYSNLEVPVAGYTIPLIQTYLKEFDHVHKETTPEVIDKMKILYQRFSDLLIMCKQLEIDMPFFIVFRDYTADFYPLVYSKNILGLTMLNLILAAVLLSRKLRPQRTMFGDYMNWFRDYNRVIYGGWRFISDQALYQALFETETFCFDDLVTIVP